MKRLFSLLIVLTMITGLIPVVSAAISQNNGLGTTLEFSEWVRNSPSNGTYCKVVDVTDDTFGTVKRYTTEGIPNGTKYTTYKFLINFSIPSGVTVASGDKVMVSFYYRINTSVGDNTYVAPKTFTGSSLLSKNATTGRTFGVSVTDQWQYVSYITTVDAALYNVGNSYITQVGSFTTSANTDKICVDMANVKAVYMGPLPQRVTQRRINRLYPLFQQRQSRL